jgi:hypothetical protein
MVPIEDPRQTFTALSSARHGMLRCDIALRIALQNGPT